MSTCQAINVSDETQCQDIAEAANDTFCYYHARQAYGLYKGYKRRGKSLEALERSCPAFLADSSTNIRNEDFKAVEEESKLNSLHDYLFRKYALLDRVIRARKLHHSRFYSLNLDYGHKAYLDKLVNDRTVTLSALSRLERRTAEVLHAQDKWFKWVRQRQDDEDAEKEKESEMVKKEARLFARHWKDVQARQAVQKRKEDAKRQAAYLDEAYKERLAQMSDEDADEEWDPIEDAVMDDRDSFVDLMKRLLWPSGADDEPSVEEQIKSPVRKVIPLPATDNKENVEPLKGKNKNARKREKAKAKAKDAPPSNATNASTVKIEVNESRFEMRKRLIEGVKYEAAEGVKGMFIGGTIENPLATIGRIGPIPSYEVDQILEEVVEIKRFLFCRLLLSQAILLPAALKAESVEAFLADPDIAISEFRDLCLKLEQPSLQEIRDACADFFRGDSAEIDNEPVVEEPQHVAKRHKGEYVQKKWRSKHEKTADDMQKAMQKVEQDATTLVDFGTIEDGFKKKVVRVKVCGKAIWNYPSNKAMPRGGWLHFSIIAKGCRIFDAIELCRNWDEFWELNILTVFKFFPAVGWNQWTGDRMRQQALQLGIIPYLQFDEAERLSIDHKAHGQSRGLRTTWQFRNVLAVHIARNSATSRRWVQYLATQQRHVVILVRDARTGVILVESEEEENWLIREWTKPTRRVQDDDNEGWKVHKKVDENMFQALSDGKAREWQFGFTDYYDVILWDLVAGQNFNRLWGTAIDLMVKAQRCAEGVDLYNPASDVLKTMRQERETARTRTVRPGEMSIWDDLHHPDTRFMAWNAAQTKPARGQVQEMDPHPNYFYSEIDAAEDAILFPDELTGTNSTQIVDQDNRMAKDLERKGPSWVRFVNGLDSDDDSDGYEDPFKGDYPEHKMKTISKREPSQKNYEVAATKKSLRRDKVRMKDAATKPGATASPAGVMNIDDSYAKSFPGPAALVAAKKAASAKLSGTKDSGTKPLALKSLTEIANDLDPKRMAEAGSFFTIDGEVTGCNCFECYLGRPWLCEGYCHCPHCTTGYGDACERFDDEPSLPSDDEDDEPYNSDDSNTIFDTADGDPATLALMLKFTKLERTKVLYMDDPQSDFNEFMDREKAKIFKACWYDAILDPIEREKYALSNRWAAKAVKTKLDKEEKRQMSEMLLWIGVHFAEHRVVWKDSLRARAVTNLFFDKDSLVEEEDRMCGGYLSDVQDQAGRAKSAKPYARTWRSNRELPPSFWKPINEGIERQKQRAKRNQWDYDREKDAIIRPVVAHLFKNGILTPEHLPYPPGDAAAAYDLADSSSASEDKEGRGTRDEAKQLFIDYRRNRNNWPTFFNGITDPFSVDLLARAQAFARETTSVLDASPEARPRFALLRVWSHSHFYPLMLGWDIRAFVAFTDEVDRGFSWKFVPKDMPGSERSIQRGVDLRFDDMKQAVGTKVFRDRVVVKRDMILVMGRDKEDLRKWVQGVVYAVQTKPWRMDIDLFKSFADVDLAFLEGLDQRWLE